MKTLHQFIYISLAITALQVNASYKVQNITQDTTHLAGCPLASDLESSIEPNKTLKLSIDDINLLEVTEENYQDEIIVGTAPDSKQCFIAIKNAESQVNESYSLYIFDPKEKSLKPSSIDTITNPDFTNSKILTSYRDFARWNYESLCYSTDSKDYYRCERREEIYKGLEKHQACTADGCEPARLFRKGKIAASGRMRAKAYLYKEIDGTLIKTKSYLIAGDNVSLIDFREKDQGAYFKIQFNGKTAGWVEEDSLIIE